MLAIFLFAGIGNASTFKQMPMIFEKRQAGGVIGWTAAIAAFGLNLVLNFAWSALFFGLKRPDIAFAEVVLLWLSIALCIALFAPSTTSTHSTDLIHLIWHFHLQNNTSLKLPM